MAKAKLGDPKNIFTRLAILLSFMMAAETALINTALASINEAFPTVDPVAISMLSTAPTVIIIIMSFIFVPIFVKRYDRRNLLIIGTLLYSIAGVSGAFLYHSIFALLATRIIIGVGAGMTCALCGMIINQLYTGADRSNMIGWQSAMSGGFGVVLGLVAGVLVAIQWNLVFWTYAFFFIVFVLMVFALPKLPPIQAVADEASGEKKPVVLKYTGKQKLRIALCGIGIAVIQMLALPVVLKVSYFLMEEGIGSVAMTGVCISLLTLGICVFCAIYGLIDRVFKRFTVVTACIVGIIGVALAANSHSLGMLFLGCFLVGGCSGYSFSSLQNIALSVGHPSQSAIAAGITVAFINAGQFLSALVELLARPFTDGSARSIFEFSLMLLIIATIVIFVYMLINPLKNARYIPADDGSPKLAI